MRRCRPAHKNGDPPLHQWPSSEASTRGRDDGPPRCRLLMFRGISKLLSVISKIMNTKIDLKSSLGGLCVGVLATFAIGAATSPNSAGSYHFGGARPQYFLFDTSTGQVWTYATHPAAIT